MGSKCLDKDLQGFLQFLGGQASGSHSGQERELQESLQKIVPYSRGPDLSHHFDLENPRHHFPCEWHSCTKGRYSLGFLWSCQSIQPYQHNI